ncbi:hypothetical protein SEA_ZOOMAN_192 [Microbacterium phage Zooman]|nr:hypothetical protein SEA_ZOOMAN_192 [Microbacterium phage Zooman]
MSAYSDEKVSVELTVGEFATLSAYIIKYGDEEARALFPKITTQVVAQMVAKDLGLDPNA